MSVMRIKDANGNWQEVAALTGVQGPEGPRGPAGDTKVLVVNMYDLKTADATAQEILDAVAGGCVCVLRDVVFGTTYLYAGEEQNPTTNVLEPMFAAPIKQRNAGYAHRRVYVSADGTVVSMSINIETPTPALLKLTGAVEAEFDGSKEVTVEIPEGGGASKYAQPEWGAENAQGYILPETDLYMRHDESSGETFGFVVGEDIQLTEGENYTVTYNGAEYKCAAFVLPEGEAIAIGNAALFGLENTGEPFLALVPPANNETFPGASLVVVILDGADAVKMAISSDIEKVYPIPAKYLEAALKPLIVTVSDDTGKCDTDFNVILKAVRAGRTVLLRYIGATYAMSGAEGDCVTFMRYHNIGPGTQGYCSFYTIRSDNTVHFDQYELGMPI